MTAPGFIFDPYSHTWRPAPPSARTRADAEACEVRRDRVDAQLRDECERVVRMASRSLGLDPPPRLRWLPADCPSVRGVVFVPGELWVRVQSPSEAKHTALHELRHAWGLADDQRRYAALGLDTMEARQLDADQFAASWRPIEEMKSTAGEPLVHKTVVGDLQVKAGSGAEVLVTGYGSVFGPPADHQHDIIQAGAFAASLRTRKTKLLVEHREAVGTERALVEDSHGLLGTWAVVADTTVGADVVKLLRAGVLDSLSIGYVPRKSQPLRDGSRLLTQVDLFEVSLVSLPSNERARIVEVRHRAPSAGAPDILPELRARVRRMKVRSR